MKYRRRSCCVTERLPVLGRGRVYTRLTEVKCIYKPSVSLV